jgi:MFS family permease
MLLTAAGMTLLATLGEDTGMAAVLAMLGLVGVGMASFSAPNASAIMGSVAPRELGLASAFLATMRVTGQALSVAVLGGIAASQLGRVGGRLLFSSARSGELAVSAERIADDYLRGYRYAMLTGAALALVGAAVSLTRGAHKPAGEGAEGPAGERVPAPVAGERAVAGDGGEPATAGGGGADAPTGDAGGRRPPGVRGEG